MGVARISNSLPVGLIEETFDVRYPFLYRPLVEFALRLPPELCVRPQERKWVLREAMRDIVPDAVRTRVGKGGSDGLMAWSLSAHRAVLEPLLDAPILGDLGVIDVDQLRAYYRASQHSHDGRDKPHAAMQYTLTIEAWLQMRSGRWPRRDLVNKV